MSINFGANGTHDRLTTDEMAAILRTSCLAIRKRHCTHGSYYGITPAKLPNGRLLWPAGAVHALLRNAG